MSAWLCRRISMFNDIGGGEDSDVFHVGEAILVEVVSEAFFWLKSASKGAVNRPEQIVVNVSFLLT